MPSTTGLLRRAAAAVLAAALASSPALAAAEATSTDVKETAARPAPPRASGARVIGDADRTRFVMDLSTGVDVSAFALADPYRVVVDLPEVAFDLPAGVGAAGRGLVKGFRYGLIGRGKSRIVIDAGGPVLIDKAFVLPPVEGQPARLVVDLLGATPASFAAEQARTAVARRSMAEISVSKSDRLPSGLARADRARPLVVIDPGHGGIDPGTVAGNGVREKDVVLAFAAELKKKLEAGGRVDVIMTRGDDTFVSLGDRVRIAHEHEADLFISVHADATPEDFVRGATVYTLSDKASDRQAAALAAKENASDVIAGLDLSVETNEVSDILIDLARRETRNFSLVFARDLVTSLATSTRMIRNPHRAAGFQVLKAPDVPSVLVELGYLSNAQDESLLTSAEWRTRVADSFADSITRYFGQRLAAAAD